MSSRKKEQKTMERKNEQKKQPTEQKWNSKKTGKTIYKQKTNRSKKSITGKQKQFTKNYFFFSCLFRKASTISVETSVLPGRLLEMLSASLLTSIGKTSFVLWPFDISSSALM